MLTDNDLKKIEQIVDKETQPEFKAIRKDIKKILGLFNFVDREHQKTRTRLNAIEATPTVAMS